MNTAKLAYFLNPKNILLALRLGHLGECEESVIKALRKETKNMKIKKYLYYNT